MEEVAGLGFCEFESDEGALRSLHLLTKFQSPKLHEVGNMTAVESNCTYSSDSQTADGTSLHRHSSSGGGIPTYLYVFPPALVSTLHPFLCPVSSLILSTSWAGELELHGDDTVS